MLNFMLGGTVVCSITIKNSSGVLYNPATSTKIIITRLSPNYAVIIPATDMTNESTGLFYYDFDTSSQMLGEYQVFYIATDGSRITKLSDGFRLVT